MSVSTTLRRALRLSRAWLKVRDVYWAKRLIDASVAAGDVSPGGGHRLRLERLGITIPKGDAEFMLPAHGLAVELSRGAGARFECTPNGEIYAEVGGARARLYTDEDVYILHELFVLGVYNFVSRGPLVVWDIGMNIALASLFFARHPDTTVVAFEPSKHTYDAALANIARNPGLSARIRTFNAGIGDAESRRKLYASSVRRGAAGLFPIPESLAPAASVSEEEVSIQLASRVLASIRQTYPDRRIFAKIDCEGAEYQIIDELCRTGTIREISVIALEWHRRESAQDPALLAGKIEQQGFGVFLLGSKTGMSGMVYAVRTGQG